MESSSPTPRARPVYADIVCGRPFADVQGERPRNRCSATVTDPRSCRSACSLSVTPSGSSLRRPARSPADSESTGAAHRRRHTAGTLQGLPGYRRRRRAAYSIARACRTSLRRLRERGAAPRPRQPPTHAVHPGLGVPRRGSGRFARLTQGTTPTHPTRRRPQSKQGKQQLPPPIAPAADRCAPRRGP